jgi:hypothetical protein
MTIWQGVASLIGPRLAPQKVGMSVAEDTSEADDAQ